MAVAATTAAHGAPLGAQGAGHGHDQLVIKRAGLWLFFFSESILFGLLLSARFYLLRIGRAEVDQPLGLAITIILLMSSLTAYTAETAIEHDRHRLASGMIIVTILLGLIFAGGVGFEWATAAFGRKEAFGTVFFTMTGIHAAHVVSGVGMLALLWVQLRRGRFSSQDHWPVSGTIMYWHFVDVVWVFFYPALYLVS